MPVCPRHRLTFDEREGEPPTATAGLLSIERARAELGDRRDYPGVRGVADYVAHLSRLESLPHG